MNPEVKGIVRIPMNKKDKFLREYLKKYREANPLVRETKSDAKNIYLNLLTYRKFVTS